MKFVTITAISMLLGSVAFAQDQTRTVVTTSKTTWNGVLVDAACQSSHTERKETTREDNGNKTTQTERTIRETTECPVTTSTTTFGLLTSDGRFVRFDNPSNTRVVEIVRSNRDMNRYLADRTPVQVKVVGTANGDVAVVESLNPEVTVVTAAADNSVAADEVYDVRYHDDRGKLIITSRGLNFENISDAKHSRAWNFSQIRELKRDGKEIKIEPYSGDSFEFKFDGKAMSDAVYKRIADRIVAARNPSR
jgi:hypothetical protein